MHYPKKSSVLVSKLEDLNHIGPSLVAPDLTLVFEDGKARDGQIAQGFEFVALKGSSKKSIHLLSHSFWTSEAVLKRTSRNLRLEPFSC